MSIADKLARYYPGAEWTCGEDYASLNWIGPGEKPTEQELADLDFPVARNDKLAALAARRWEAQTGGTTLNGLPVKTDETTTANITAAYFKASQDPSYVVRNWKMETGFFTALDAATVIAIGGAIEEHVQACFDREADLTTAIMLAADVAALNAIDIETGWPT